MAIVLVAVACKKSGDGNCGKEIARIFSNSAIDTVNNAGVVTVEIVAGSHTVFNYWHHYNICAAASDGDYIDQLLFRVPATATSFSFSNAELSTAKTYYARLCFCPPSSFLPVTAGNISGVKVETDTWQVTGHVKILGTNNWLSFNQIFTQ